MTDCVMVDTCMVSVPRRYGGDWAYGVGHLNNRKLFASIHVSLDGSGPLCEIQKPGMQVHDAWGADVTCTKCRAALGRAVKASWQQQEFQLEEAA
jgi:hypothetical protein